MFRCSSFKSASSPFLFILWLSPWGNSFVSHPRPTWMKLGISLKSQLLPLALDGKQVIDLRPLRVRSWTYITTAWLYCSIWKFKPSKIHQGKVLKDIHSVLLMSDLMTSGNRAWWAGVSTNARDKRPSSRSSNWAAVLLTLMRSCYSTDK